MILNLVCVRNSSLVIILGHNIIGHNIRSAVNPFYNSLSVEIQAKSPIKDSAQVFKCKDNFHLVDARTLWRIPMQIKDNLFGLTLCSKKSSHQAINSCKATPWVSTEPLRRDSSAVSSENL